VNKRPNRGDSPKSKNGLKKQKTILPSVSGTKCDKNIDEQYFFRNCSSETKTNIASWLQWRLDINSEIKKEYIYSTYLLQTNCAYIKTKDCGKTNNGLAFSIEKAKKSVGPLRLFNISTHKNNHWAKLVIGFSNMEPETCHLIVFISLLEPTTKIDQNTILAIYDALIIIRQAKNENDIIDVNICENINTLNKSLDEEINSVYGDEALLIKEMRNNIEDININELKYDNPLASGIITSFSSIIGKLPMNLRVLFEDSQINTTERSNFQKLCDEVVDKHLIYQKEKKSTHLLKLQPFADGWSETMEKHEEIITGILRVISWAWRQHKYKMENVNGDNISENSYVADIVSPLINATLDDLPTYMMVSVDVFGDIIEFTHLETSRPISTIKKNYDDRNKLARLNKDGLDYCAKKHPIFEARRTHSYYKFVMVDEAEIPLCVDMENHTSTRKILHRLLDVLLKLRERTIRLLNGLAVYEQQGQPVQSYPLRFKTISTP
ncbi:24131_t:CDS:10, partial [Entrophospora sp. SA101]